MTCEFPLSFASSGKCSSRYITLIILIVFLLYFLSVLLFNEFLSTSHLLFARYLGFLHSPCNRKPCRCICDLWMISYLQFDLLTSQYLNVRYRFTTNLQRFYFIIGTAEMDHVHFIFSM